MPNPILVELTRGPIVESVHRGSVAVADSAGKIVFALGDLDTPVYPRSSLKPIQALPLVESGAADAFGIGDEEIALACASHSGEPMHTTRVAAWLSRIGCGESDLACGAHPSRYEPVAEEMIRRGEKPTRIFNNCSGKHTGFLSVARHWDIATKGYEHHDHPVQRAIAKALAELTGIDSEFPWGVDGCAAPNFAVPLGAQARAFARPDRRTRASAHRARDDVASRARLRHRTHLRDPDAQRRGPRRGEDGRGGILRRHRFRSSASASRSRSTTARAAPRTR